MNHSRNAYTAIIGSECIGNLQKPFVSALTLQREGAKFACVGGRKATCWKELLLDSEWEVQLTGSQV